MYSDILFLDNNQKGGKSMSRDNKEVMSKSSGFATAGLVLGIIGVCTSFIPIINNLSFVLGVLAIIFGVVAFFKKIWKGQSYNSDNSRNTCNSNDVKCSTKFIRFD